MRAQVADYDGSSPRVRGTPSGQHRRPHALRFIPACAGNACMGPSVSQQCHGSSPRVRGTLEAIFPEDAAPRFIPACAGNAVTSVRTTTVPAVHPRVCGERMERSPEFSHDFGSSPRVRGTPSIYERHPQGPRFIPACAGNACGAVISPRVLSVHPRVCGERRSPMLTFMTTPGSSPRVRGTRGPQPHRAGGHRFIPACAGNASAPSTSPCLGPVHPRVCGERRPAALA